MSPEVEVQVDPAAAVKAELIEAETRWAVERAWCADHSRVDPTTVRAVKVADGYTIALDGATFLCTMINAREVGIARVQPHDHQLMEPARRVSIPPVPEPPVPPDLVHQAYAFKKASKEARDRLTQDVQAWHDLISPETEPLARLRMQYPGCVPTLNGQAYNDSGLVQLAEAIARVVELRQTVPTLEATDRRLVEDGTTMIRLAISSVTPAASPGSIRMAGESVRPLRSQVEVNLDGGEGSVQDQVDILGRALDELAPTIQRLIEMTPSYLEAALLALREGVVDRGALFVQRERQRLEQGRTTGLAVEVEATRAVTRLFLALERPFKVPYVAWSLTEPWEAPKLS